MDPVPIQSARLQVFDFYQRIKPREATQYPSIIIDIDESSLAAIGQWPWPRTVVAELVARLFQMGALVVAFDVFFPESDRLSPEVLAEHLPNLDQVARDALRRAPRNDAVFADVIRQTRVILGQAPRSHAAGQGERPPMRKAGIGQIGGNPRPYMLEFADMVRNLPELEAAAAGLGSVSMNPEPDGVTRRIPLVVNVNGEIVPSLVVEMLRVATGQAALAVRSNQAGIDSVVVGGVAVPTDGNGRKWIYFSPHSPDRYLSARDVLDGNSDPQRIAGKLVFVGTSAAGLGDIRTTALTSAMPGVEAHAQLLETLLSGANLVVPNYALGAELVLLVASIVVIVTLMLFGGGLLTFCCANVLLAGMIFVSWHLFATQGLLIDVSYSAMSVFLVYSILTFTRYLHEESATKAVRSAFSQYLSPTLVDRLAENPDQLRLGGETRWMTVLFADVRSFSKISERCTAEELTTLINRVLTRMTEPILRQHGTIDKYVGDNVMAFWNAPLDDPDHARNACLAALQVRAGVARLNDELSHSADAVIAAKVRKRLAVKVGINTGECSVGNMGSDQRFNYSVLGDAVNLASRLEGQCSYYGCWTIVGETTASAARDLALLELDLIRVKGKNQPARIFALLGDDTRHSDPAFQALSASHDGLLAAYRAMQWEAALDRLAQCRGLAADLPLGRLYELYEARIDEFRRHPPPADWDGVYEATAK